MITNCTTVICLIIFFISVPIIFLPSLLICGKVFVIENPWPSNFYHFFHWIFLSQRTKQIHNGKIRIFWNLLDFILNVLTSVKYGNKKKWLGCEKKSGPFIALWSSKSKETFLKFQFFCKVESKIRPLMRSLSCGLMKTELNKMSTCSLRSWESPAKKFVHTERTIFLW